MFFGKHFLRRPSLHLSLSPLPSPTTPSHPQLCTTCRLLHFQALYPSLPSLRPKAWNSFSTPSFFSHKSSLSRSLLAQPSEFLELGHPWPPSCQVLLSICSSSCSPSHHVLSSATGLGLFSLAGLVTSRRIL
jgi:hypothetical protein